MKGREGRNNERLLGRKIKRSTEDKGGDGGDTLCGGERKGGKNSKGEGR